METCPKCKCNIQEWEGEKIKIKVRKMIKDSKKSMKKFTLSLENKIEEV